MTQEKLDYFKDLLIRKRQHLEFELSLVGVKNSEGEYQARYDDWGDDEEDNASEMETYTVNVEIEGTLEETLRRVDRALERIENGTYGKDIHTGESISEARLSIYPEAETAL